MKNVIELTTKLYLLEGENYVWWSKAKEIFRDVDIDKLHLLLYNSDLVRMEDIDGRKLTYGQSKYSKVVWYKVNFGVLESAREKLIGDCWTL